MSHEPARTCVGCRARDRQSALVRLVVRDETLAIDGARALPGRGAYLHRSAPCLAAFARRGGFVRSLRCVVAKDQRETVRARLAEDIA